MSTLEFHNQIGSKLYWSLRSKGFDNIEAEVLVAKYRDWYRRSIQN